MKRLTERDTNGTAMAACCGENCKHNFCCESGGFAECRDMDDIIDRLAAIEDILGDEYDLDRLRELVEADREQEFQRHLKRFDIMPPKNHSESEGAGTCYIERELAVSAIRDIDTAPSYIDADDVIEQAMYKLDKIIPAADVAPVRHGTWIHPHWCNDVSAANCSECGAEAQHREYRGVQKYYKVCPSCGALMDTKEENNLGTAL